MRVSDNMKYTQVRANLNKNRADMADLQNKAASQKRVTKPSDDPIAAARVLTGRVEIGGQNQYLKNMDYARSFLNYTDQSLGDLTELLVRVKELALGQSSDGGANEQSRKVVGTEVNQIFKQLVLVGNRKMGDRYIFGGYKTTEAPFDGKGNYKGDAGEMLVHVEKDSFISMNVPGNKVFLGEGLSGDGISHSTAVQPKTTEELVAALEVDRQESYGPNGKKKDVNDSQNSVQASSASVRGPASLIMPQSLVERDIDGEFVESVRVDNFRKGSNIFNVVKDLEISLMTNSKEGVQDALETIDEVIDQVVLSRSQVGARVTALENIHSTTMKNRVDTEGVVSQLEDVDLYKVVSDMNKTETSLEATMKSSSKLIQPSLMDFLR